AAPQTPTPSRPSTGKGFVRMPAWWGAGEAPLEGPPPAGPDRARARLGERSLVPQRLDRIERRGLAGREHAGRQADQGEDRYGREPDRPGQLRVQQQDHRLVRGGQAVDGEDDRNRDGQSDHAAGHGQEQRLEDELGNDVATPRTDRELDPDLPRP